jgi:hypothetical protein
VVEYSCDETKCTAKQPDYLNQEKADSAWSLIDSVVPAIGGKSSITFEVSCVVNPAARVPLLLLLLHVYIPCCCTHIRCAELLSVTVA